MLHSASRIFETNHPRGHGTGCTSRNGRTERVLKPLPWYRRTFRLGPKPTSRKSIRDQYDAEWWARLLGSARKRKVVIINAGGIVAYYLELTFRCTISRGSMLNGKRFVWQF